MSAISGQASSNDGTIYNSYHQAGTAPGFCEMLVLIFIARQHSKRGNPDTQLRSDS